MALINEIIPWRRPRGGVAQRHDPFNYLRSQIDPAQPAQSICRADTEQGAPGDVALRFADA